LLGVGGITPTEDSALHATLTDAALTCHEFLSLLEKLVEDR
jgi:hypothetical protein